VSSELELRDAQPASPVKGTTTAANSSSVAARMCLPALRRILPLKGISNIPTIMGDSCGSALGPPVRCWLGQFPAATVAGVIVDIPPVGTPLTVNVTAAGSVEQPAGLTLARSNAGSRASR